MDSEQLKAENVRLRQDLREAEMQINILLSNDGNNPGLQILCDQRGRFIEYQQRRIQDLESTANVTEQHILENERLRQNLRDRDNEIENLVSESDEQSILIKHQDRRIKNMESKIKELNVNHEKLQENYRILKQCLNPDNRVQNLETHLEPKIPETQHARPRKLRLPIRRHDNLASTSACSTTQILRNNTFCATAPTIRTHGQTTTTSDSCIKPTTLEPAIPSRLQTALSTNVTLSERKMLSHNRLDDLRSASLQSQRTLYDVLGHTSNGHELPPVVIGYLQTQFSQTAASLCRLDHTRFHEVMVESACGNVCVQRKASNIPARVIANEDGACDYCVWVRQICLQKDYMDSVVVVPLPEFLRLGKRVEELSYWVRGY